MFNGAPDTDLQTLPDVLSVKQKEKTLICI